MACKKGVLGCESSIAKSQKLADDLKEFFDELESSMK